MNCRLSTYTPAERVVFDVNGGTVSVNRLPVNPNDPELLGVYRDEVTRHVHDEAVRLFPQSISFHYESLVTEVDLDKQCISVKGASERQVAKYDILIGADGANSIVRQALSKMLPSNFVRREKVDVAYMTGSAESDDTTPTYAFMQNHQFESGAVTYFGKAGDARVALFTSKEVRDRLASGDKEWLLQLSKTSLPKLTNAAREAVQALINSSEYNFHSISGWTHVSQLHGPKVALVGDAAHSMTPVLGQGCNSGLEDVHVLSTLLQKHGDDLSKALASYSETRLPDIRALIMLNKFAAGQAMKDVMSNGLAVDPATRILLKFHVMLRTAIHKAFPRVFRESAYHTAMKGQGRYSDVPKAMYHDASLVGAAIAALVGIGYYISR